MFLCRERPLQTKTNRQLLEFDTQGLLSARRHLAAHGVFAVWAYAESSPFAGALRKVFEQVRVEPVTYDNRLCSSAVEPTVELGRIQLPIRRVDVPSTRQQCVVSEFEHQTTHLRFWLVAVTTLQKRSNCRFLQLAINPMFFLGSF